MPIAVVEGKNTPIKLWTREDAVEAQALDQLRNIATLPWIAHLAVMPDVHFGIGATVGSVIAMRGAVCPAAVGVDIGCGMGVIKTNLRAKDLPDSLRDVRLEIESLIPVGFNAHKEEFSYADVPGANALWAEFKDLTPEVSDFATKARLQGGTLGGGNHFIELCLDTEDVVWMMLHSGSRGIGNKLATVHMEKAHKLGHNEGLVDRNLASFLAGTPEMTAYRRDLFWAQRYALLNRRVMFTLYERALRKFFPHLEVGEPILCHHNYMAEETHFGEDLYVTRKGAIRAGVGEMGIIPGSMGTRSFIVRGLGNPESLFSASHGAGRRMSRKKARKTFTVDDLAAQTVGVECRKDAGVLDEIPASYKDIREVMQNQSDLVEVVAELHQVLCVKGETG